MLFCIVLFIIKKIAYLIYLIGKLKPETTEKQIIKWIIVCFSVVSVFAGYVRHSKDTLYVSERCISEMVRR